MPEAFKFMDGSGYSATGQYTPPPTTSTGSLSFDAIKQSQITNPPVYDQQGMQTNIQPADRAVTLEQLQPTTAITLPTPTPTVDQSSSVVAGAQQTTKTIEDYIKELTPPQTAEQTQADTLTKQLSGLLDQTTGQTQALYDEEAKAGVPELSKSLNDINSQIKTGNAEYEQLKAQYEQLAVENRNRPVTMGSIQGTESQIRYAQASALNVKASEVNMKVAQAQAMQGNISLAKESAAKAVELRFSAIEDQLRIKTQQLQLIQPMLDKQERIQAAALQRQYQDQQAAVAEAKAKANQINEIMLNAAEAGADAKTLESISKSPDLLSAAQAFGSFRTQQFNLQQVQSAAIKTPYANAGGEIWDSKTGYAYTSEQDFQLKTGMSLQTAEARGLISPIATSGLEWSEPYKLGGDYVQKNNKTGQIRIAVNVPSGSGSGPGSTIKFTPDENKQLLAAGFNSTEIAQIQSDVSKYGVDAVVEGMSTAQATAVKNILSGFTPNQIQTQETASKQFLTKDYFKNLYTTSQLEQAAADAGFGDLGEGVFNLKDVDTEEYLNYLEKLVSQYRQAGYTDQEILKMMQ